MPAHMSPASDPEPLYDAWDGDALGDVLRSDLADLLDLITQAAGALAAQNLKGELLGRCWRATVATYLAASWDLAEAARELQS